MLTNKSNTGMELNINLLLLNEKIKEIVFTKINLNVFDNHRLL